MEDDFDDDFIEEEYDEENYESEELNESENSEETDVEESDVVSEIYQPKVEKKVDVFKNKSRNVIIVPPEQRITDNRLHKNEASFIISTRAKEIANNATHFVENSTSNSAITLAYQELYTHKCPLKLRRQVGVNAKGDVIVEEWDTKTMVLPNIPPL